MISTIAMVIVGASMASDFTPSVEKSEDGYYWLSMEYPQNQTSWVGISPWLNDLGYCESLELMIRPDRKSRSEEMKFESRAHRLMLLRKNADCRSINSIIGFTRISWHAQDEQIIEVVQIYSDLFEKKGKMYSKLRDEKKALIDEMAALEGGLMGIGSIEVTGDGTKFYVLRYGRGGFVLTVSIAKNGSISIYKD